MNSGIDRGFEILEIEIGFGEKDEISFLIIK
jgi:hypothetical protein